MALLPEGFSFRRIHLAVVVALVASALAALPAFRTAGAVWLAALPPVALVAATLLYRQVGLWGSASAVAVAYLGYLDSLGVSSLGLGATAGLLMLALLGSLAAVNLDDRYPSAAHISKLILVALLFGAFAAWAHHQLVIIEGVVYVVVTLAVLAIGSWAAMLVARPGDDDGAYSLDD